MPIGCAAALLACAAFAVRADLTVPEGASWSVGEGATLMGCTDVTVSGTTSLTTGVIAGTRHMTIDSDGVIRGGSGMLAVSGNVSVDASAAGHAGQFQAGTSTVVFDDSCGSQPSIITADAAFYDLAFLTSTPKTFAFAAGSTQRIAHSLVIAGTASAPVQFKSTVPGQVAFIDLALSGTQQISHVGVTDVWATGQPLAPTGVNEGGGGNARGWFGVPLVEPPMAEPERIPTLANAALAVLSLVLMAGGLGALQRRRPVRRQPESGVGGAAS